MARAWDNANFTYRREIRIDPTNVGSNLSNFPVLVAANDDDQIAKAHIGGVCYWAFYDHNGTKLSWDWEYYAEGASYTSFSIWVGVPVVYASPTGEQNKIWMYYDPVVADEENEPTEVWTDAGYAAVWHLNESAGAAYDSTGLGHDGTFRDGLPDTGRGGKIGCGQDLDGTKDGAYFDCIMLGTQTLYNDSTIEGWIYFDSRDAGDQLWEGNYVGLAWDDPNQSTDGLGVRVHDGTAWRSASADPGDTSNGVWYHVAGTWASVAGEVKLYIDGVLKDTDSDYDGTLGSNSQPMAIGASRTGTLHGIDGIMDEWRYSSTAKSAHWIAFEYANVNEADFELAWQAEEEGGEPPTFVPYPYPRGLRGGMTPNLSGGLLT